MQTTKLDTYCNQKVLITGHTGFKGSWLCFWLRQLGAEVYGYSLEEAPSRPSLFETLGLRDEVESEYADIANAEHFSAFVKKVKPNIAFHMAAQSLVLRSYESPLQTFSSNVMGSVSFLEAFCQSPSLNNAVYVTSDKCYDNNESGRAFEENDPKGGKDPYSASKGCAELVFQSYVASFLKQSPHKNLVSVRAGNVVGGGDWSQDRLVPDCMRAWYEKAPVRIRNPEATRPWQHVFDVLGGYLLVGSRLLAGDKNLRGEAFNFGPSSESERSVADLLKELQAQLRDKMYCEYQIQNSEPHKEAKILRLNTQKAKAKLAWNSSLSFRDTVALTAQWYTAFHDSGSDIRDFSRRQLSEFASSCSYLK